MKISVVVCVYNREKLIERCVHSLLSQSIKDYEIIVVDDASTDGTRAVLIQIKDPKLTVLFNGINQGPSYARNRGIKISQGEYIAFIDSDCIAEHTWLEEIIKPFALDPLITIVSGKTIDPQSATYWEMVNEDVNFIARREGYVPSVHSCNMALRADFMKAHLFDERLLFSEDLDLCFCCGQEGKRIYYTPKPRLLHFHRTDCFSSIRSHFRWGVYNTPIRWRWGRFPFLNYGTFILLGLLISSIVGMCGNQAFWLSIAAAWGILFLMLVVYISLRPGNYTWGKLIMAYPGRLVLAVANCLGNCWGITLVFKR